MPTIGASVHLILSGDDTGPNWEVVGIFSRRSGIPGPTESPESHAAEHARPQAEK
jgi:hypothetical protein